MSLVQRTVALALLPLMAVAQAEDDAEAKPSAPSDGFAPYQTILDRMPFGPVPPNFDPEAPPGNAAAAAAAAAGNAAVELTESEQQIVSSVRVSILNVTPSGEIAVGFTDSAAQPAENYYLKVGEKRGVWEVKEADPAEQTVVLVKNGIEATLKVGEGTADGKGAKGGPAAAMQARQRGLRPGPNMPLAQGPAAGQQVNAMDRLRARRQRSVEELKAEEARREAAAAEARKDAAQAAAEREQQREALLQIQEELRRQREEREQREAQAKQNGGEDTE